MVFHNDFAERMEASTDAGLESPIPIHVFEAPDGSAREFDPIFERIVMQATAK